MRLTVIAIAALAASIYSVLPKDELAPLPPNWHLVGEHTSLYQAGIDLTNIESVIGAKTLRFTGNRPELDSIGRISQSINASVYGGKRLRFSGRVRTIDVNISAGLFVTAQAANHDTLASDEMNDRPITGTSYWSQYDVVIEIPNDTAVIAFGLRLTGAGQVWVDKMSMEVVGDNIPVTTKSESEQAVFLPATPQL